jgi:hypothetical protein
MMGVAPSNAACYASVTVAGAQVKVNVSATDRQMIRRDTFTWRNVQDLELLSQTETMKAIELLEPLCAMTSQSMTRLGQTAMRMPSVVANTKPRFSANLTETSFQMQVMSRTRRVVRAAAESDLLSKRLTI